MRLSPICTILLRAQSELLLASGLRRAGVLLMMPAIIPGYAVEPSKILLARIIADCLHLPVRFAKGDYLITAQIVNPETNSQTIGPRTLPLATRGIAQAGNLSHHSPPEPAGHRSTIPFPGDDCRERDVRRSGRFRRSAEARDPAADFRSPSVNGHSCYGHLTARFAPFRSLPDDSPEVSGG